MATDHRERLSRIRTFPSLVKYLRDELDWPIAPRIAEALMTAITTDTGWLRFANTDGRCLRIMARLVEAGVRPDKLYRRIAARAKSIPPDQVAPKPMVTGSDLMTSRATTDATVASPNRVARSRTMTVADSGLTQRPAFGPDGSHEIIE